MFNDPRTIEEIKKNILLLQEQTEAIKKEAEAIKKETEAIKKETEGIKKEAEAIKKETDVIRKEGESKHNKNLLEIDVLRKEREKVEKKLQSTLDGLGFSIGMSAEELFINSIEKTMEIDGIKYYEMTPSFTVTDIKGKLLSEIDIVLFNKKYICIIEVKHNAKLNDLNKLTEKTIPNFIKELKKYKKYTILPFIAAMSFDKNVIQFAKDNKIGLLKFRGEHFKVIN